MILTENPHCNTCRNLCDTLELFSISGSIRRFVCEFFACLNATVQSSLHRMIVVEVELDESEVEESHDHNEHFFQCKAYIHHGDIEVTGAEPTWEYTFDF